MPRNAATWPRAGAPERALPARRYRQAGRQRENRDTGRLGNCQAGAERWQAWGRDATGTADFCPRVCGGAGVFADPDPDPDPDPDAVQGEGGGGAPTPSGCC